MAEKRKPALTLLLRKPGKAEIYKIELFPESQWREPTFKEKGLYRLRVNGRWLGKGHEYYTVEGFCKDLAQSIEALL